MPVALCHLLPHSLLPSSIFFLSRCPDQGEGLPEAGGRSPRPLQHHLLRHPGWDPALPPHTRTGLPLADAAAPPPADRLLPEDHRQAGGRAPGLRRRPVGHKCGGRGSDAVDCGPGGTIRTRTLGPLHCGLTGRWITWTPVMNVPVTEILLIIQAQLGNNIKKSPLESWCLHCLLQDHTS